LRQHYVVLTPTDRVVAKFAELYAVLGEDRLKRGGVNDQWTAACALVQDPPMPIITDNLRDFEKIAETAPALTLVVSRRGHRGRGYRLAAPDPACRTTRRNKMASYHSVWFQLYEDLLVTLAPSPRLREVSETPPLRPGHRRPGAAGEPVDGERHEDTWPRA
jgi:hypothetical protein